ncbi:hypothetical protein PISMIDRAFT_123046 [Pisolithus microcarpus 441]|uniref:Unplaced genomic scaffold scaffold_580, whole genome shotgun sequence n=1 Tax=Pisolithus microcarpus 441 TaxID=765257 RepID=A0A0C9YTM8_9AGAM|nr:hypothetical protein PISMIDRAFT_123046 [Pisolithus microcarpus 441]
MKLCEMILVSWKQHMDVLRADLSHLEGAISVMADIWSDHNRQPYLGVTAHWIKKLTSGHLALETALIAFHHILGLHDRQNLAKVILQLLDCVSITTKVSPII